MVTIQIKRKSKNEKAPETALQGGRRRKNHSE